MPFGVIAHAGVFSRYRLTFEYRWGGAKFAPRKNALRDAGVLLHVAKPYPIWPDSLECQIQEGDSGDLVFLGCGGLTWLDPDPAKAPAGQGVPGMLAEEGGIPKVYAKGGYIGRFPEYDRAEGWNRMDVIVQADDFAEFRVNGHVKSRVAHLRTASGAPLASGGIALQLEGAEILYRDVRLRTLGVPLRAVPAMASLSAVKGVPAATRRIRVSNPSDAQRVAGVAVTGADASAFTVSGDTGVLAPDAVRELTVSFAPKRGPGRYSAAVRVGDAETGAFVPLQGIAQDAFEGKNETPLQAAVYALGIPVNVGGTRPELDTAAATLGDGKDVRRFRAAASGRVRVTPVARFSPKGRTPFGIVKDGSDARLETGVLADSEAVPDAHQSLLPPLAGGAPYVEFDAPEVPFGFYMEGRHVVSFTDPARPTKAKIARTARVRPVSFFQGMPKTDTWLIGFEAAANGDYQDTVFLVENVVPAGE